VKDVCKGIVNLKRKREIREAEIEWSDELIGPINTILN
jgi:hypothetical protein